MSITKGDVEEAKENIRKFLRKPVFGAVYPVYFYYWCSVVAADVYFSRKSGSPDTPVFGRLEALAKALDWSIVNKTDKTQFANLVHRRLLGYAKIDGKYPGPEKRIWRHPGPIAGKFKKKVLTYVKNLLGSSQPSSVRGNKIKECIVKCGGPI